MLEALALEPGDEVAVSAITHPDMVRILEAHGLLGVTDTPVEGSAPSAQPTDEDVATIIAWFRDVLPEGDLRADCVLSSFAGFRVLPPGRVGTARASRRQTIHPPDVRPRNLRPSADPLPGALLAGARAAVAHRVEPRTAAHLLGLYGGEAVRVLEYEDAVPDALEPIHPDGPDIWAQAHFALDEEMAVAAEDIASRRTTLMLRGWLQRRS